MHWRANQYRIKFRLEEYYYRSLVETGLLFSSRMPVSASDSHRGEFCWRSRLYE